jgi:flagellar basal body-associated protein FliL
LEKSKKGESSKKKGSSNMLIILSVVGVVVLLAVGITLFFVLGGSEPPKPVAKNPGKQNPGAGATKDDGGSGNPGETAPAFNLDETITKVNEMVDKLADTAKYEEAARQIREILDSDAVNKANGRNSILMAIANKAKDGGNGGAKQFLQKLSKDTTNGALAQAALKVYNENVRQEGDKDVTLDASNGEEPTNYLPNKVDVVFSLKLNKFLDSEYKKGVFNLGAFRPEDIDKRTGLPANTIDQFVVGGMKDFSQVVGVIRTTSSYNWDDFKKATKLEENGTTIKGKTYYLGKIDFMTEFLGQRIPGIDALKDKAAFWRVDAKTIVYGDETTIKDILENPPEKDKAPPAPTTASNTPPAGGPPSGGPPGGPPRGLTLGSAGGPGQGSDLAAPGGTGGEQTGGAGQQPAELPGRTAEASKDESFTTVDAKLRRLINLTKDQKNASLLIFADKTTSKVPTLLNYLYYLDQLPATRAKEVDTLVLILPASDKPSLKLGVACKTRSVVRDVSTEIEKLLTRIGKEDLQELFGFDFKLKAAQQTQEGNSGFAGGGGFGGGGFGAGRGGDVSGIGAGGGGINSPRGGIGLGAAGGTAPPGAGIGEGSPPSGGGRGSMAAGGGRGGPPGGANGGRGGPPMGIGGGSFMGGGGTPPFGGPPQDNPDDALDNEPGGNFSVERSDEYIIITASIKSSLGEFIDKHMKSWMQQIRGSQEMASGRFRLGDLAASMDYLKKDLVRNNRPVMFPQGAFPRTFDAERGPRPYPANERVSFLRELLPYIGDDRYFTLRESIDAERSWNDPANVNYARILVPHFLNPAAGPASSYVKVRGIDSPLAATHFVGMAGVGPDAAYYGKNDPRAGIFGYDRQTSLDDVKDGLSNTIYMIEADKALLGPWLEGGGSTVRGTSAAGNDIGRRGGFSSPNYGGKPGVWVIMADGSTRFLTKDISPEVFKALCTMAGGDSTGAIDLIAKKVTLEVTPRTETASAIATSTKKKIADEEEAPVAPGKK